MPRNDGGPAFPAERMELVLILKGEPDQWHKVEYPGMTLRQYYAGQALAGNLANHQLTWPKYPVDLVEDCFKLADAMIAERNREEQND